MRDLRNYINLPVSADSKQQLQTIADGGIKTWLDLANLLFVYMNGTTYTLIRSIPRELQEIKAILDTNKPYWILEREAVPQALETTLPEYIVESLNLIKDQYLSQRHSGLRKHYSLRHAILMIMSHALHKEEPAEIADNHDHDLAFDDSGFIENAAVLLDTIHTEFQHSHRKNYGVLHTSYILESISALKYIRDNYVMLSSKRQLANLLTENELDNVPYHAENHHTNQSSLTCLRFIVNSYISAFIFFQSQNKLDIFFSKLYGGNCIEGRLRSLFKTFIDHQSEFVQKSFQEELREKAPQYARLLIATGNNSSMLQISKKLFADLKNRIYIPDENYLPNGQLTEASSVERFAREALVYDDRLAIADPDGKNGDINSAISLFQAIIRGAKIRRDYTEIRDVTTVRYVTETTAVAVERNTMLTPLHALAGLLNLRSLWRNITHCVSPNSLNDNVSALDLASENRLFSIENVRDVRETHQKRFFVHPPKPRDDLDADYVMVADKYRPIPVVIF